jgi:hypothetical protein
MTWGWRLLYSSQLCIGKVHHSRFLPRQHSFVYPSKVPLIDLDSLNELNKLLFVSVNRPGLYSFYESDFLKGQAVVGASLKERVINLLQNHLKEREQVEQASWLREQRVKVFLLCHLRFLGRVFNPISVFYVFVNGKCQYHISEVSNTPWNERFIYIHQLQAYHQQPGTVDYSEARFSEQFQEKSFDNDVTHSWCTLKKFHVSPFNPIEQVYLWAHRLTPNSLSLTLRLKTNEELVFNASFNYKLQPLTNSSWRKNLWFKPFSSIQVVWSIYWQALKLFIKRIPIYDHPKNKTQREN